MKFYAWFYVELAKSIVFQELFIDDPEEIAKKLQTIALIFRN